MSMFNFKFVCLMLTGIKISVRKATLCFASTYRGSDLPYYHPSPAASHSFYFANNLAAMRKKVCILA